MGIPSSGLSACYKRNIDKLVYFLHYIIIETTLLREQEECVV